MCVCVCIYVLLDNNTMNLFAFISVLSVCSRLNSKIQKNIAYFVVFFLHSLYMYSTFFLIIFSFYNFFSSSKCFFLIYLFIFEKKEEFFVVVMLTYVYFDARVYSIVQLFQHNVVRCGECLPFRRSTKQQFEIDGELPSKIASTLLPVYY